MCFNSGSLELMNRWVVLAAEAVVRPGVVSRDVVVLIARVAMASLYGDVKLVADRGATVATANNLNAVLNLIVLNTQSKVPFVD